MGNEKYCPKCGELYFYTMRKTCWLCSTSLFEVNPKWGITDEKEKEIMNQAKYGEKTKEECKKQWEEFCTPFYNEVVKKRPEFDQYLFEHREEISKKKCEEFLSEPIDPLITKAVREVTQKSSSSPTIKCPYCSSIDTKKISTFSRGLFGSLFGLGSSKIGKQWHCNKCGSDF